MECGKVIGARWRGHVLKFDEVAMHGVVEWEGLVGSIYRLDRIVYRFGHLPISSEFTVGFCAKKAGGKEREE